MAVGPSLRQLHSHKAIHEGGLSGAESKTADVIAILKMEQPEKANEALEDLLDYWETRIIAHADSEEDGFYQEVVERNPEMQYKITQLIRDHDLLKILVADIRSMHQEEGFSIGILHRLQALIIVNEIHSRDEEKYLFEYE